MSDRHERAGRQAEEKMGWAVMRDGDGGERGGWRREEKGGDGKLTVTGNVNGGEKRGRRRA